MALTATFAGDFQKFEASLKSAVFNLQAFDRATDRAMQGLKKQTESFSGQKVAIEAARMAEAVKRLGGDAGVGAGLLKLLPEELKRVEAAMTTAAEKARLLGETLPPSLQKVRDEIAKLPTVTPAATAGLSSITAAFRALGPLIGITSLAGAVTGLVRMGVAAVDAAGQMADLADQTGLSTDAIQEMQAVAQQTGTSVDTFTQATFRLGVTVAEGGTKARDAIKDLGLEYARLRAVSPETQFREVVRALEGVESVQERNRLGVALMGRQYSELAAAVNAGYSGMADAADKSTAAQIRALDRAGDAWEAFKQKLSTLTTGVLGDLVIGIEAVAKASESMSALNLTALWITQGPLALKTLREIGLQLQANADLAAMRPVASHGGAPAPPVDFAAQLAEITKQVAALDAKTVEQLNAALKLGGTAATEYADRIGIGAEGLEIFKAKSADAAKASKDFAAAMAEATITGDGFAAAARWMEDLAEASQHLELTNVKKLSDLFEFSGDPWMDEFQTALDLRADALRRFHEDHSKDITKVFDFGPDPGIAAFERSLAEAAQTIKGTFVAAFKDLPQIILRALEGGGDLFKSIGALFGSKLFGEGSDLVKAMSSGLSKAFGKSIGGALGVMLPGLGTLLGSGLGALADKLFGNLFGGQGKKVNDLRDQFTAAAGGIDKLAEHAAKAGLTLKQFYAADTVKEYEAAIRQLEDAFGDLERNTAAAAGIFDDIMALADEGIPDFLQPHINQLIELGLLTDEQAEKLRGLADDGSANWDKIAAAAEKYGIRLESLGQPFNAQRVGTDAAAIINAFEGIVNAGGDVGGVLFDMQDEIAALVADAKRFNIPLPANLKPLVEELQRAGLLTEDLTTLQFGDAIETEAEKTRKAFEGITEAIRELIRTINQIPSGGWVGSVPRVPNTSPGTPGPSEGAIASIMAGGGAARATYHIPIEIDGRTVADVVIDQMGNRLAVRGAR